MNNFRYQIVIPSKDPAKLGVTIGALREAGVAAHVIVVWDGVEGEPFFQTKNMNASVVAGVKPFCFGRNVNIGIRAAGGDDVLILNDDAMLILGSFDYLSEVARQNADLGLVAPLVSGATCAVEQKFVHGKDKPWVWTGHADPVLVKNHMLPFVCVYIRREVIEELCGTDAGFKDGPLSEQFYGWCDGKGKFVCHNCHGFQVASDGTACQDCAGLLDPRGPFFVYGGEDDELCYRIRQLGLGFGLVRQVIVDHQTLKSEFRAKSPSPPVAGAQAVFRRIHGFDMGDR